jgi:aspartate 1-decarboxylase
MMRVMLKSKIHNATITETQLEYEGSIEIDGALMREADMLAGERVQVLNLNNGNRFETYVIEGKGNSGVIGLRGPAALKGKVGDKVFILSYAIVSNDEAKKIRPKVVYVDENNRVKDVKE